MRCILSAISSVLTLPSAESAVESLSTGPYRGPGTGSIMRREGLIVGAGDAIPAGTSLYIHRAMVQVNGFPATWNASVYKSGAEMLGSLCVDDGGHTPVAGVNLKIPQVGEWCDIGQFVSVDHSHNLKSYLWMGQLNVLYSFLGVLPTYLGANVGIVARVDVSIGGDFVA